MGSPFTKPLPIRYSYELLSFRPFAKKIAARKVPPSIKFIGMACRKKPSIRSVCRSHRGAGNGSAW